MSGNHEILGRYVDVEGVRTYYESAGEGDGMLCIHSAGRDSRQWQAYLTHFSDRYRVVSLDLPGHFKSWPMPGNRCIDTPNELADFLWNFSRAVGLVNPILLGCSVGGDIVLLMAQQHPEKVKALIAFDGADFTVRKQSDLLASPHISIADYIYDKSLSQMGRMTTAEIREFIAWNVHQTVREAQLADNNVFCTFDVRNDMDKITCPSLLVRGSDDFTVSKAAVEDTAKRLTKAQFVEHVEIEGAGHWSHQEMPDKGCAAIEHFLKNIKIHK
jgi:pimeloyl-ACP methyl ester carboxylesterase